MDADVVVGLQPDRNTEVVPGLEVRHAAAGVEVAEMTRPSPKGLEHDGPAVLLGRERSGGEESERHPEETNSSLHDPPVST